MDDFKLPNDLADLEGQLANRSRIRPSASFRDRLVAAVRFELSKESAPPVARCTWQFAATVAAAVLLWSNFSMCIANDMDWLLGANLALADTETAPTGLHKLFREPSDQVTSLQGQMIQSGSRLPPLLDAQGIARFEHWMKQRQKTDWN
jgi:hypothetical protein